MKQLFKKLANNHGDSTNIYRQNMGIHQQQDKSDLPQKQLMLTNKHIKLNQQWIAGDLIWLNQQQMRM